MTLQQADGLQFLGLAYFVLGVVLGCRKDIIAFVRTSIIPLVKSRTNAV